MTFEPYPIDTAIALAEMADDMESLARELAIEHDRAREVLAWLVSLDDAEGPGAEARRTVTLNQIIGRARAVLEEADGT
ncbi:MAG TPA: hypothetical protein VFR23_04685 [Jiangellaceae bacterium]|nr:hypothetical protein [Jiangellaceae bacterium]